MKVIKQQLSVVFKKDPRQNWEAELFIISP